MNNQNIGNIENIGKEQKKMERAKYIIRQVPAENAELSWYFEGDCFKGEGEYYGQTLFILQRDRWNYYGVNVEEWNNVRENASHIIGGFGCVDCGEAHWDGSRFTYKEAIIDAGYKYSPAFTHKLKEWFNSNPDTDKPEDIAEFLTITTGKKWSVTSSRGYCQGDYCEIVFCEDVYTEKQAQEAGDIYLGAASEYCLITLDENGQEIDSCFGFIVSDWRTNYSNLKETLCELTDTNPDEVVVQIVKDRHYRTEYEYEEV